MNCNHEALRALAGGLCPVCVRVRVTPRGAVCLDVGEFKATAFKHGGARWRWIVASGGRIVARETVRCADRDAALRGALAWIEGAS